MKKIYLAMLSLMIAVGASAGEKDEYFRFEAGFLFNSTLNATFGYEHELTYGNAIELTAEVGNRWHRDPVCGKVCNESFWKDYYWDGGLLYKHCLKKYKNSNLRLRFGPQFGAHTSDYFFAVEGGLEYNYVFPSGVQFSLVQKNQVGFLHGDTFRNGLLIGLSIPFISASLMTTPLIINHLQISKTLIGNGLETSCLRRSALFQYVKYLMQR